MDKDFCTVEGAFRLKRLIEQYWRERNYAVEVKLMDAGFGGVQRSRMDVRSDMVDGLPAKRQSIR